MSRSRFASITGDLLVRKGEAKPWQGVAGTDLPLAIAPQRPKPAAPQSVQEFAEPVSARICGPVRRCAVRLSECEYQRLGILAVKKDTTRQQILRDAVEAYLTGAERDYGRGCGCLTGEMQLP